MTVKIPLLTAVFTLLLSAAVFSQGSLTPSGAPAPSMKGLDQVQPATPITGALPYLIAASGSYYLTGDMNFTQSSSNAIYVAADNVTIDLKGLL